VSVDDRAKSKTAAEVCQHHIDNIEAKRPKALMRSDLTDAVAAAVLDLLYLTRNTDVEGRRKFAEFDRDMARMRGGGSEETFAETVDRVMGGSAGD
jgi:hypothetical protein